MQYDVYAIGNALVDSEYTITAQQLIDLDVERARMTLIDLPRRQALLSALQEQSGLRTCGGSAANTVIALAQLGAKTFYSCKVASDPLGQFYCQDLLSNGVDHNLALDHLAEGHTGTCIILVTPDAERSMNTFLGATTDLDATSLNHEALINSQLFYIEGYLVASDSARAAAIEGYRIARENAVQTALTLSDVNMVNFFRDGLHAMLGDGVDLLFCNLDEAQAWCQSEDMAQIHRTLAAQSRQYCLTLGDQGCSVWDGQQLHRLEAVHVNAMDTNGAGDLYAACVLHGHSQGWELTQSARFANNAAGLLVTQHGNRLSADTLRHVRSNFDQERLAIAL